MRSFVQRPIELGVLACIGLSGCSGTDSEQTTSQRAALSNGNPNKDDMRSEYMSRGTAPNGEWAQLHLQPIVNCVALGTDGKLRAHFGYRNSQDTTANIQIGPRNAFVPAPFGRGQPTEFTPGENDNVVSVAFDERRGPLVWELDRAQAIAWKNSPPCVPSFAGAASATVLSDSEVTLTWPAATDYTTPSSSIVYDICSSATSGDCAANFIVAQTTAAGVLSAIVSGLTATTAHFFVVRARNAVGNEDANTEEVAAQTCTTGDRACNGMCTSLASDPANCGACGNQCPSGASCSAGQCVAPTPIVAAVAAGPDHTCALLTGGEVKCWGSNAFGQLGNGTTTDSAQPVTVSGLVGATAVVAGSHHTCALGPNGEVGCWGDNSHGQLGNGTTTGSSTLGVMFAVSGSNKTTMLTAGGDHTCALLTDGTVQCWGANGSGQLGNGTGIDSPFPVAVADWGTDSVPQPSPVIPVSDWRARSVTAGAEHTCVVLNTSLVQCWGWTSGSPLGAPHTIGSSTPVRVSGCRGGLIAAGGYHTCTQGSLGEVYCWGWNDYGQLGNGSTTSSMQPSFAEGVYDATALAIGGAHTCVTENSGTHRATKCWGNNDYGQLGDGTTANSSTPLVLPTLGDATELAAGGSHTCALTQDGTVYCWGNNSYGQLGNGSTTSASTPIAVKW